MADDKDDKRRAHDLAAHEEAIREDRERAHREALREDKLRTAANVGKSAVNFGKSAITEVTNMGGAAAYQIKKIAPGTFSLLFLMALGQYYYLYKTGFSSSAMISDVALYVAFATLGKRKFFGWDSPLLPLIARLFMSQILVFLTIFPIFRESWATNAFGIVIIIPWWIVYCLYLTTQGMESKLVNFFMIVSLVVAIAIPLSHIVGLSDFTSSEAILNQQLANKAISFVSETFGTAWTGVSNQWKIYLCKLGMKTQAQCEEEVLGINNQAKNIVLDASLDTSFMMDISGFTTETDLIDPKIQNYVTLQNNIPNSIQEAGLLTTECGLLDRNKGKTNPEMIVKTPGFATTKSITCELNTYGLRKNVAVDYYFNVTAHNAFSSGYKEFILVSKTTRDEIIKKYQESGATENRVLELSREFGPFIQERRSLLNPRVGKEDLVQPILKEGVISSFKAESPLIYGVDKNADPVDFALYIKNNGNGFIEKITSIKFTLPPGIDFDKKDCGFNKEDKRNLKSILPGEMGKITSCQLEFKGQTYPNSPQSQTIGVDIIYDYTISKKQTKSVQLE